MGEGLYFREFFRFVKWPMRRKFPRGNDLRCYFHRFHVDQFSRFVLEEDPPPLSEMVANA